MAFAAYAHPAPSLHETRTGRFLTVVAHPTTFHLPTRLRGPRRSKTEPGRQAWRFNPLQRIPYPGRSPGKSPRPHTTLPGPHHADDSSAMSLFPCKVVVEGMGVTTSTRARSLESPTRFGDTEDQSSTANGDRAAVGSADEQRAKDVVARAFAGIVSRRYPGTSWLPVKRSGSNDGFVVPTGKVVRLLPGPADVHAESRIGHPAASAADRQASHEHRANPCA